MLRACLVYGCMGISRLTDVIDSVIAIGRKQFATCFFHGVRMPCRSYSKWVKI